MYEMRNIIWLIICGLLPAAAMGAVRKVEEAAVLAAQFAQADNNSARRMMGSGTSVALAEQYMQQDGVTPAMYVFNRGEQDGFVLISADDRLETVLGYTDSGHFDGTQASPALKWWLRRYAEQISAWSALEEQETSMVADTTTAISPLLGAVKWAQEVPYYNRCPKDLFSDSISMTGCVATAAAQIMKKWQYPEHGTGTHSYECCQTAYQPYRKECQTLALNFDTISFDWAGMRDVYRFKYTKREAQAVATLMYACGVACDMIYTSDGSASYTDEMGKGLITYFGYTYEVFATACTRKVYRAAKQYYGKDIALDKTHFSCTTSELEAYLNADLEAGRPVLMGGQDEQYGGHEFVCDGRDESGKYHFNWGWSGGENGYYTLSALGKSYNFCNNIDMLVGLQPATYTATREQRANQPEVHKYMQGGRLCIKCGGVVYDILGCPIK